MNVQTTCRSVWHFPTSFPDKKLNLEAQLTINLHRNFRIGANP